jgi:hypothetical protein
MGTGIPVPVFQPVRHRLSAGCLGTLLLAACFRPTPAEKAAQDAREVAEVEAIEHRRPPLQRIRPQPIDRRVRSLFALTAAGCDFLPDGRTGDNPVLVAGQAKAALLIDDKPVIYVADSGSPPLPFGTRAKYVGRIDWAQLDLTSDEGAVTGKPRRRPGALTIRDRFDRIVFFARGTLVCHG